MQAGWRVEIGEKQNITDFALWKFSPPAKKRQMEWDSPWGIGFPGWHIECSAMAVKYLGQFFDIHCGGEDHIMVHHPNEIAQTQVCYGTRLANFWMHGSFLQIDAARMGKSVGNFMILKNIMGQGYDPLVWRMYCLNAHYRAKLNFSIEGLNQAATALDRLRKLTFEWGESGTPNDGCVTKFWEQINDDLNVPRAMAIVWDLVTSELPDSTKKATILKFDQVLGLGLANWQPPIATLPEKVKMLAKQRELARRGGDWEKADSLREQIRELGYEIEDTQNGTQFRIIQKTSSHNGI